MNLAPLGTVRVATWNIRGGVGLDRRFDLERIVRTIKRAQPDVIALQEVDSRRGTPDHEHPFLFLRRAFGEHCVEAKSIISAHGEYGQILISRWPLAEIRIHDISVPRREPRRAIETEVLLPHGKLHLVATHLGLTFRERRNQTQALVNMALRVPHTTVMMGDFNDWIWRGSVQNAIHRALPARTWHRTFPSFLPLIRLDRIYCRPREAMVASFTDRSAYWASDHLPVFADIRV
ncbi:MAG TPA: endonuclease/exonuclease/phosphatase family protein [Xanthobacteraceae bacterium]|nr:endonuclease/exonuclease/phosphatase family protein [Xanthobacteraceae bacterium]